MKEIRLQSSCPEMSYVNYACEILQINGHGSGMSRGWDDGCFSPLFPISCNVVIVKMHIICLNRSQQRNNGWFVQTSSAEPLVWPVSDFFFFFFNEKVMEVESETYSVRKIYNIHYPNKTAFPPILLRVFIYS